MIADAVNQTHLHRGNGKMKKTKELRTEKVSVMLTPSMRDRLDSLARARKGRASMSSAAADIIEAFFAEDERERSHHTTKRSQVFAE
jgi:hypothetical protein